MPYLHYILRAMKPEANINRVYGIYLDQGLFQSWIVMIAYGRYRSRGGIQKNYSFPTVEEAKSFVDKTLKKRFQAQKRIGCSYKVVNN